MTNRLTRLPPLLIVLACTHAPPPAPAPGPDLTPFQLARIPETYRLVSHRTNNMVVQGRATTVGSDLDYTITVTPFERDSDRGLRFALDSMHRADGQVFDLAGGASDVSGTTLSVSLDSRGHFRTLDLEPDDYRDNPVVGQISAVLQQFFPRIPTDGIVPGNTWSDTTSLSREQQGADITIEATTEYEATQWSDTTIARIMTVRWSRRYTVSGTGEQLGQAFTIDGAGTSNGKHRFGVGGRYLGTTVTDSSESQLMVTSLGISLPLFQVGADTILFKPSP